MINNDDENDKTTAEYDKIFNDMIESNIMNNSVESSELQPDSDNEEFHNNMNTNMNNKGSLKVNIITNITPEKYNSMV